MSALMGLYFTYMIFMILFSGQSVYYEKYRSDEICKLWKRIAWHGHVKQSPCRVWDSFILPYSIDGCANREKPCLCSTEATTAMGNNEANHH